MAVVPKDVQQLSLTGEFDALDATATGPIQRSIDRAARTVSDSAWGDLRDDGVANLATHLLAVGSRGSSGKAGPVTAEAGGGLSRSYGGGDPLKMSDAYLARTTYGQEYARLKSLLILTPLTTNTVQGTQVP